MTKTELINNLNELPADIIREAYVVDVAAMKTQILFNPFLKAKYQKNRSKPTGDKGYDKEAEEQ